MPYFTNDAIVLALLLLCLAFVFVTSNSGRPGWVRFYTIVPPLLLCYFLPALLNWPLGLVSDREYVGGGQSQLYFVASRFLLPAALVLLCLSVDLGGLVKLGYKAVVMFLAATAGIVLGGPLALLLVSAVAPQWLGPDGGDVWRGLSTVAGSWIGGGANQTAMKEIYQVSDQVFSSMVIIDVVVANIWMGCLLFATARSPAVDRWLKADTSAVEALKQRVVAYEASVAKIPTTHDLMMVLTVAFVATGLSHWTADQMTVWLEPHADFLQRTGLSSFNSSFFWLVVTATTVGIGLSFTRLRRLEGAGASKIASVFIYLLVATIGMKMDLSQIGGHLGLFSVGLVWMAIHVVILVVVGKCIRAPFFFIAVGSQANVGGAASAPIVASAFHPALAPVGGIMAVWGYALGTYGAILCAQLMRLASNS